MFRRWPRARKKGKGSLLLLAAVLLAVGGAAFSEWGLGSVSRELTREAARGYALSCVNQAVKASLEESGEFVTVERDEQGEPLAVHADTTALNALRSQVLARLEDSLNGSVTVDVPAGSLTGIALLNGRGFPVPLKLRMEGSADLAFETEFGSAGINQSCHRITMVVTVQLYSQSQRFETQVHLETSTVLAETVLVGQVPQAAFLETG